MVPFELVLDSWQTGILMASKFAMKIIKSPLSCVEGLAPVADFLSNVVRQHVEEHSVEEDVR